MTAISVIMTAYNAQEYIAAAINSILIQTFKDFELIIVDDGSTDNTFDEIKRISDHRIKAIRLSQNSGIPRAANKGIEYASGKYIARMDADDIANPLRLEKQFYLMENNDISVCGSWFESFGKFSRVYKMPVSDNEIKFGLFRTNAIANTSLFARSEIFSEYSYDERLTVAEDYDLLIRLTQAGDKFYNIPETLMYVRKHNRSITARYDDKKTKDEESTRKRFYDLFFDELDWSAYEILKKFFVTPNKADFSQIKKIERLLNEMQVKNRERQIINQDFLAKKLNQQFSLYLKSLSAYKPKMIRQVITSKIFRNIGIADSAKFIVKCLINHKR